MKDLGKIRFCLSLQIEHLPGEIFVHQSTYTKKVMKSTSINMVKLLDANSFTRCEKGYISTSLGDNEELFSPKLPYLSAISALMYLANNTILDIAFSVNLLARSNSSPIKMH